MTAHTPLISSLVLAAGLIGGGALHAQEVQAPNRSSFRYVDENQRGRVYPIPPPDTDPTGASLEELRERATALEERVERLEAALNRILAQQAAPQPHRERGP